MLMSSTGYKTSILGSQSFADIFNGGTIHIYSANRPLLADSPAPEAFRIAQINRAGFDGGLLFAQNGPYIQPPPAQSWEIDVSVTGNALWFRLMSAADTNDPSYTQARIDGDVATAAGLGELILQSSSLVAGTALPVDYFLFTIAPYLG